MKTHLILILMLISSIFLLASVRAEGEILLCLENGDRLEFSDCNPEMNDYVCHDETCQICTRQLSNGVYCPAMFNLCDSACVAFDGDGDINQPPLPANAPVITLTSPSDSHSVPTSQNVDFIYTVDQYNKISSCSLILNGENVKTKSTTTSTPNKITFKVPLGTHSWKISCKTKPGFFPSVLTINSQARTIIAGSTSPPPQNTTNNTNPAPTPAGINLVNPENDFFSSSQSVTFSFDYIGATSSQITSCKLHIDSTPYSISKTSRTLTKTLTPGAHSWKIECIGSSSSNLGTLTSPTRSLTINDPSNPIPQGITLNSPSSGFSATGQQDITFTFSFAGISSTQINTCTLDLNGQQINVDKTSRTHTQNLAPGQYTWSVKCTKSGGELTSESRTLTINAASPTSDGGGSGGGSSGGGGGGGGGGGSGRSSPRTTPTTAADENTILLSDSNDESEEETSQSDTEETQEEGSRISGAVTGVGDKIKGSWFLSLLLILLVLAIIFLFVILGKKKDKEEKAPKMNQSFKKK